MKHKTDHHKLFITLLFLLTMGIAYFIGKSIENANIVFTILLVTNTLILFIILNMMIEIHGGKQVLHVIGLPKDKNVKTKEIKRTKKKSNVKKTKKRR
ncbi:MAG: hypothetical protein ACOC3X_00370 [Nanoarchaeota archaeon]